MATSNHKGQQKASKAGYELAYHLTQPNGRKGLLTLEKPLLTRYQAKKLARRETLRGKSPVVVRVTAVH